MKIVKTYDDLNRYANEWNPKFTTVSLLEDAADYINFPHEDYPEFVTSTVSALVHTIHLLTEGSETIEKNDILDIHKICMEGKEYLRLGEYRSVQVQIQNNIVFPEPYLIPSMMVSILPVSLEYYDTKEKMIEWYKKFETIHPFEDGNGRVGGIILAALSFIEHSRYIVNEKEYKFVIDPIIKRITNQDDEFLSNRTYFDISTSYEERCFVYLRGKLPNVKFNHILLKNNANDKLLKLIEEKDLDMIINFLNNLK